MALSGAPGAESLYRHGGVQLCDAEGVCFVAEVRLRTAET